MMTGDLTWDESASVDLSKSVNWDDLEFKLSILGILNSLRRRDAANGGASLSRLNFLLLSAGVEEIKVTVDWLKRQGFVECNKVDAKVLQITVNGVDFLADQYELHKRYHLHSPHRPPGASGQRFSWWSPPPPPPDDKAGVRKNPYPTTGAGEIALPLPEAPREWI